MRDTETDMKSECRPTMVLRRLTSWLVLLGVVANLGACAVSPAGHRTGGGLFFKIKSENQKEGGSGFFKKGVGGDGKKFFLGPQPMQEAFYEGEGPAVQRR